MSKIASLFAIMGLTACGAGAPAAPAQAEAPTLAILGPDGVTCAAVAVTSTLAVTASHCTPERDVAFVTALPGGQPGHSGYGVVVARSTDSDLAVIATTGLVPATLVRGAVDYERATTLITHVPEPWSVGRVRPSDAREGFLQTERLETGMSGSGLWDDEGHLVGIAVGNGAEFGFFAGAERIRRLVQSAPVYAPLPAPAPNAEVWGDPNLSVDKQMVLVRRHRARIQAELHRVEATAAEPVSADLK